MTERELQHSVRLALGRHPTARLWRNQVGECDYCDRSGQRRHLSYGLVRGSSDLIGLRTMQLPGLPPIAQFVAIELKTDSGRLTEEQRLFLNLIRERGGLSGVCRS